MGLKTTILRVQETECEACAVPVAERTGEQVMDAGIKAIASSDDAVAFLVQACSTVPMLKQISMMFLSQYLKRNGG